jgi:tRNA pseudouridine38-40 synthase
MSDDAKREREDGAEAAAGEEAPSPKAARADDADAAAAPAADAPAAAAAAPKERPNGKKRKVVVLLGYVGAGYQGMQRNPGAKTIEDELERAFHAAGGISNENMGDFSKARKQQALRSGAAVNEGADKCAALQIQWTRAARTDKGVSAVGQAVALKARAPAACSAAAWLSLHAAHS